MSHASNYGWRGQSGGMRLADMHEAQHPGGVVVDPLPITSGAEITILYNGLLPNNGAQEIYLHAGYGESDNWHDLMESKMSHTGWGFVKTLEIKDATQFNFCFRDNAYNWDNNTGHNWSFQVHNGKRH